MKITKSMIFCLFITQRWQFYIKDDTEACLLVVSKCSCTQHILQATKDQLFLFIQKMFIETFYEQSIGEESN